MTLTQPSPIAAIREHRQRQERRAFRAYMDALRRWDDIRERTDGLVLELQVANARLQERMIAGCSASEAARLLRACRQLQDKHRRLSRETLRAKEHASAAFTALVAARQARENLNAAAAEDAWNESNLVAFPAGAQPAEFSMPQHHWN